MKYYEYYGDWNFTVEDLHWCVGYDDVIDTIYYTGNIHTFFNEDAYHDIYYSDDILKGDQRITIEFLSGSTVTPEINADGSFELINGYHFELSGYFTGFATLDFVIDGLGGLGCGETYTVHGEKVSE